MRKLLNTIYVTNEQMYLMLDGENLVCKAEGEIKLRIPFENVENIVCFSYLGCSPALMGKCVEKLIPINFMSPQGKFLETNFREIKEQFQGGKPLTLYVVGQLFNIVLTFAAVYLLLSGKFFPLPNLAL